MKCFPHEPLSESIVFLYCQHLSQKQPDSSAPDQLCQALNFAAGVLGLATVAKTLVSARVQGLAHQCMRQQKPPKQAPALTTDQVRWLQTFAQSDEPQYERYLAASFLFMMLEPDTVTSDVAKISQSTAMKMVVQSILNVAF